jgi:hypothetical protein
MQGLRARRQDAQDTGPPARADLEQQKVHQRTVSFRGRTAVAGRWWLHGAQPDPGKIQRGRQPGWLLRHVQALTCSRLCSTAMSAAARPEAHPSSSVARLPRS